MNITKAIAPDKIYGLSSFALKLGIRHAAIYTATDAEGNYEFGSTAQEARLNLRRRYRRIHGDARFDRNAFFSD